MFSCLLMMECRITNARIATFILITGVRLPATMMQTGDGELVKEIDFVSSKLASI